MNTFRETQADEALRLIDGEEILDTVGEAFRYDPRIICEPLRHIRVHPAAPLVEFHRQFPVEEGEIRFDVICDQLINERIVERNAFLVDRADAFRDNTGPVNREAIRLDSQFLHKLDVFFVPVIMVTGDVASLVLEYLAIFFFYIFIPQMSALAALILSAFNLITAGGSAPDKIVSEFHCAFLSYPKRSRKRRNTCELFHLFYYNKTGASIDR